MNKIISIFTVLIVAIVAAIIVIKPRFVSDGEDKTTNRVALEANEKRSERNAVNSIATNDKLTIESQWQWQALKEQYDDENASLEASLPFTQKSVHDALYGVKIDENGDIILDTDALISLDEALERIYNRLDAESTLKLQDLIQEALPGKVGEQTAKIVGDYSDFLKAKEQFSLLNENTVYVDGAQSLATVGRDESLYGELQALREVHLGHDVSDSLFREHDATAQYMFDSMKLGMDDSLSAEVKEQRRQEIEARYRQEVPLEASDVASIEDTSANREPIEE